MSVLAQVSNAIEAYDHFVERQVARARSERQFRDQILERWQAARAGIGTVVTPTGLKLPRLAVPQTDEPGEITRYLYGEGLPGEFPFVNAAYPEIYLAAEETTERSNRKSPVLRSRHAIGSAASKRPAEGGQMANRQSEEPTRLFAGLGLAADTNRRFHYLTRQQKTIRLSTAFDGPTLYGLDSDADGVFGKIGEGGVAIDPIEDMERLYAGFLLGDAHFSLSMTINGPAPILLATYIAAARPRFGPAVIPTLRGRVRADALKEVQPQNEIIFPIEASL